MTTRATRGLCGPTPLLAAADLVDTITFYTQVLDFELAACWPSDEPTHCTLEREGSRLMFYVDTRERRRFESPSVMTGALCFTTATLDRFERSLPPRIARTREADGLVLSDPNGYRLRFAEA